MITCYYFQFDTLKLKLQQMVKNWQHCIKITQDGEKSLIVDHMLYL